MTQTKYHNGTAWTPIIDKIDDYSVAVKGEIMGGVVDGTNRVFTTTREFQIKLLPDSHAIAIYKSGIRMNQTTDYVLLVNKTIQFVTAPAVGSVITADYDTASSYAINGSLSSRRKEPVAGTKDGVNKVFTTSVYYLGGTLEVYINGVYEGNMVEETDPLARTFTLTTAPLATDNIQVSYQTAISASGNADTVDGYHANNNIPNSLAILNSSGRIPFTNSQNQWMALSGSHTATSGASTISFADANENYDPNNWHSGTVNPTRIIPVTPGIYIVTATCRFADSTGGVYRGIFISLNGTEVNSNFVAKDTAGRAGCTVMWPVTVTNSTDYITVGIQQDTGGNLDVNKYAVSVERKV